MDTHDGFLNSYMSESLSYICKDGRKLCLVHGLRQLTRDTKSLVSCLQTMLTRRNENLRMTFGVSRHITFKEIIEKNSYETTIIGTKNNQSSSSDAVREIPSLGSTDNAGNSVNLVSGIIHLPRFGISLSASENNDRFSVYSLSLFDHAKGGKLIALYTQAKELVPSHRLLVN